MKTHKLKTWPEYFPHIVSGAKTFEVRRNDRNYAIGDTLWLQEWNPETEEYTGRSCMVKVGYVADLASLCEGFVGMSIYRI